MKFLKNLFLFLATLFFCIVLAIIGAEVIFYFSHGDWYKNLSLHVRQVKRENVTKDKELVFEYTKVDLHKAPDSDSALREYVELINFHKNPGLYRVLCIGGSTTRGVGGKIHQSYPSILQKILEEKYPARFEVFNLGVHGGTTWDFLYRFSKASSDADFGWKDLKPDLVILAPVWNDLRGDLLGESEAMVFGSWKWKDLLESVKRRLSSRCALGYYIYQALALKHENILTRYQSHNLDFIKKELEPAKQRLRNRIVKIINLWKKERAKVYLVIFPSLIEESWSNQLLKDLLKANYPESAFFGHRQYPLIQTADREVINSIAKAYKIRCFDFSDLARGIPAIEKIKLFTDAVHLNPELNNEIAEDISKGIIEELRLDEKLHLR